MALASQLSHKLITNLAIPYKTFTSPIDQDEQFVAGRNIMINSKMFCSMRPGFADYLENAPTTFNHLLRLFSWARWDGTYFVMAVDINAGGFATVYKLQMGTDPSFVQIHQEPTATNIPYSFTTANNYLFFSNGNDAWKWSPDRGKQHWGIVAPPKPTVGLVAGTLTTTAGGYYYVVTYYNSVSGHESSPSPLSACTGNFAGKTPHVTWTVSSDPQADMVNIYRTTDGGSFERNKMGFVAQVSMGSAYYADNTTDAALSATQFSPYQYQNDPPPPMRSICVYAGRIWGIAGSKVWYSGQEEIANGVPQEAFPGASVNSPTANFYAYETLLTALAPMTDGVAVFTPNRIQKIEGDSLDTFRRFTILAKRGAVSDYSVKVVGQSVLWFDRSNQLWLSDQGEIGRDIRPDLANTNTYFSQAAIHIAGEQHWICLLDAYNPLLYVYDLDISVWNVPWTVSGTCIESIDTAPGITRLAIGMNGTQVRLLNPNSYVDGVTAYGAFGVTNPISLAPENNPDFIAALEHVAIESNQFQPMSISVRTDEDPGALSDAFLGTPDPYGGFSPLTTVIDPPRRVNGTYLIEKHYKGNPDKATPACRRCAVRLDWTSAGALQWMLYSIDFAMIPVGR